MQQQTNQDRVSDAPSDVWVYRFLPRALWPHAQLARWDRPIGWQLLMWPCVWSALLVAPIALSQGLTSWARIAFHLLLFFIGSVAMRGAGCTYNDLVDRDIDARVARTRSRPLPSGRISARNAALFLGLQALVGLIVLLQFNSFTIVLGLASLGVVAVYPFAKRFTDWPQLFLGLAFSWGGLMGWAAAMQSLSMAAVFLYLAAVAWTIGYDTIYAHQDAEDDALVGVRSTALLFGSSTRIWLAGLYGLSLVLMALAFGFAGAGWPAWLGLIIAGAMLGWQLLLLDISDSQSCLALFKFNTKVGAVLSVALLVNAVF